MADTLTRVIVKGTYQDPNQPDYPMAGKVVQFIPGARRILNAAGELIGTPTTVNCVLDDVGHFEAPLVATNSPDMQPVGWTYTVKEPFGGDPFPILVPFDAPDGVVDLVDVAPAAAESGGTVQLVGGIGITGVSLSSDDTRLIFDMSDGTTQTSPALPYAPTASIIPITQKGAALGVATLDSGSKVPTAQIPDLSGSYSTTAAVTAIAPDNSARAVGKNELTLNAKDHGAVGDGTADDTVALQAWLDLCKSSGRRGWLPAGKYMITSTLKFQQVVAWSLTGEAGSPTPQGAVAQIIWGGAAGGTMLLLEGVYQGVLSDILLDGNNVAAVGLDFDAVSGAGKLNTRNVTVDRLTVYRCTDSAVLVDKSHFDVSSCVWRDCAFNQGGIGVNIRDANAVWLDFDNCQFQDLNIGITAIESGGTGGQFNMWCCRFLANAFDIKPYTNRATVLVGCQSELSGRFIQAAANADASFAVSAIGCAVNGTTDPAGIGIFWAFGGPLTLVGCTFNNRTHPTLPYKIKSQLGNSRVNIIGCSFPDGGGPWTGQSDEFGPAAYLIGSSFALRADSGAVQSGTGEVPMGSWATPKFALATSAGSAPNARGAGMVWVKVPSGTALTTGANKFYVLSDSSTGLCAIDAPFVHSVGGADAVLLGISGKDVNASTTHAVEVNVRVSAGFTLTSDMIFALRFVAQPVTY